MARASESFAGRKESYVLPPQCRQGAKDGWRNSGSPITRDLFTSQLCHFQTELRTVKHIVEPFSQLLKGFELTVGNDWPSDALEKIFALSILCEFHQPTPFTDHWGEHTEPGLGRCPIPPDRIASVLTGVHPAPALPRKPNVPPPSPNSGPSRQSLSAVIADASRCLGASNAGANQSGGTPA
jgi:hypothetical protein